MPTTQTIPELLLDELSDLLASSPTPEQLLDFHPSKKVQQRLDKLLAKQGKRRLSEEEEQELDQFMHAEILMRLVKAKVLVKKKKADMSKWVPRKLRADVRERAGHSCEYCLLPEELALFRHGLDHIIARKHRGETTDDNLAWTCAVCNRLKGSDIASIDPETGRLVRLFNPRRDSWSRHFRLENACITPLTSIGRVTEYMLQFNRPEFVLSRQALIRVGVYPS